MIENKTINYCWFGKNKKPELVKKCIASWKKLCPDYKIIEWNEDNYDFNKNKYMKEAYQNKKWAFVSDYARLDIIYNHGGIYLDTDVELIKSLDEIVKNYSAFFCYENEFINTGLGFGANKNNKIVKSLLDSYNDVDFVRKDGSLDLTSCPRRNYEVFKQCVKNLSNNHNTKNGDMIIYTKEYFCPIDYETKKMQKTKNTIGIHWYGESWLNPSKRIINKFKTPFKRILGPEYNKIKNMLKRKKQ